MARHSGHEQLAADEARLAADEARMELAVGRLEGGSDRFATPKSRRSPCTGYTCGRPFTELRTFNTAVRRAPSFGTLAGYFALPVDVERRAAGWCSGTMAG